MPSPAIEQEFRRAFDRRDATELRRLLQLHADARALIDAPIFPFDSTALGCFAGSGDVAIIDVLLEFGADPNRRSGWWAGGFHPLHGATPEVAERLIAGGADVDACAAAHLDRIDLLGQLLDEDPGRVHERGGDGQTPLHFARSREAIDLLLARGADIDARDVDHRSTAAEWMLERRRDAGRYALAEYLVERGATADIFLAAALGRTDRLRKLIAADATQLDRRTGLGEYGEQPPSSFHIYFWTIGAYRTPLQVAVQFGQPDATALMRELASPKQRFLDACLTADEAEAKRLLRASPGILDALASADRRALTDAASARDAGAVALMIGLGFDPAVPGHNGGNALHCAAWEGAADCTAALLDHPRGRALIDVPDPTYGGTPLSWCCHGAMSCADPRADHVAVASRLLGAGASPIAPDDTLPAGLHALLLEAWEGRNHG